MKFVKLCKVSLLVCIAVVFAASACFASGKWGYDGQDGVSTPVNWAHEAESCNGKVQSPIDIPTGSVKKVDGIKIELNYNVEADGKAVEYSNNGHAVTVKPKAKRSITIDGGKYTLLQFHFHTLSEHTVDGKHSDMEMHLVHADEAFIAGKPEGKLAVLGVMIKEGAKNETLAKIFDHLPHASHGDKKEVLTAELDANYEALLPKGDRKVYAYSGSLTTPGCNEIVSWLVLDTPIELSKEQIAHYRALFVDDHSKKEYHTNRPVQPLNGREVSFGNVK
ncbi:carbonic anhydrase [Thermodesulfobacteriota bacterium]